VFRQAAALFFKRVLLGTGLPIVCCGTYVHHATTLLRKREETEE
jgi:hypothetical protein